MKSERRHELETNQLADWAGNKLQAVAPYSAFIVGGLLLLVVAAVGLAIWTSFAAASRGSAWAAYFKAVDAQDPAMLKESANEYAGYDAAGWALVKAGEQVYEEGVPDMFSDKKVAADKLKDAEEYYRQALKNAGRDQARRNQAKFGLAQVLEDQGKIDDALNFYKDLATATGPMGDRARTAVAELSDKNSPRLAWAKYHQEHDPDPSAGADPFSAFGNPHSGVPGMGTGNSGNTFGNGGSTFGNGGTTTGGSGIGTDPIGTNPLGTGGTGGVLDGIGVVPDSGTTSPEGGEETGGDFKPPMPGETPEVNPDSGGEFVPPTTEDPAPPADSSQPGEPMDGEPADGEPADSSDATPPAEPTEPTTDDSGEGDLELTPPQPPQDPAPAESSDSSEPSTGGDDQALDAEPATP